jgi:hypothetical protein
MSFVPFALIPWALVLARLGEDDVRAAAGVGVMLGLAAIEGGTYPLPYMIVALAVVEGPRVLSPRVGPLRIARLTGIAIAVFALLAGVKLYPELIQLARHPRHFHEAESQTWSELIPMFLDNRSGQFPGHLYVQDEYRAYIGPTAMGFALAGVGAALILKPRRWDIVLLAIVGLLLTRGRYSEASPYALLTRLPVYEQLRVPSRFAVLALFGMAAGGGVALEAALTQVARKRPVLQAIVLAVAAFAIYDPIYSVEKMQKTWATEPMLPRPDPAPHAYRMEYGTDFFQKGAEYPARNMGATVCNIAWNYPEGTGFMLGDRPQAYVDNPQLGAVTRVKASQNAYDVEVTMNAPGAVHFITDHDPDWRTDVGEVRRNPNGQLDVWLPAGKQSVRVRYRPAGLVAGASASIAGVALVMAVMVMARKRRRGVVRKTTAAAVPGGIVAA